MKTLHCYLMLLLLICTTLGCDSSDNLTAPEVNDARELIVGSSYEAFGAIYRLNVLTGQKTRIPISGKYPCLAPNGQQLAYYADYHPSPETLFTSLYVANLDETNEKRIANIAGYDTLFFATYDWSPDSKQIIYASPREGGIHQICLFDLENNCEQKLTVSGQAWDPEFSSDGGKISYVKMLPGEQMGGVYIMDRDGSKQHLFVGQKLASKPVWSLDAKKIVYSVKREPSLTLNSDIFLCDADETSITQLTFDGKSIPLAWSPDSKKILFLSGRNGSPDLYLMDHDGKNQTSITSNMNANILASWSPGGKLIVFAVDPPVYGEFALWLWQYDKQPRPLQVYTIGKVSWIPKQ